MQSRVLTSIDSAEDCDDPGQYPAEFLHSLLPSGVPPHALELKEGMPVMLLRNMDAAGGLANGTRLKVDRLANQLLHCTVTTGAHAGMQAMIPTDPHAAQRPRHAVQLAPRAVSRCAQRSP